MRTFNVRLPRTDKWGAPADGFVETEPAPTATVAVRNFVEAALPDHQVEHLGREAALDLGGGDKAQVSRFFAALHLCFQNHYPFAIRPEVLWHIVATEVAETVRLNPKAYRHLFTDTAKREKIEVRDDTLTMDNPTSDWSRTLGLFNEQMRATLPPGIVGHLVPSFTTHTPESLAAATVALMDASSPYYDYKLNTLCGIPCIRLDGKPEDYRAMVTAASALAEVFTEHLGPYFANLLPVLKTLAGQADGAEADEEFWKSVYKYDSQSGGPYVSGWITAFLAYHRNDKGIARLRRPETLDWQRRMGIFSEGYAGSFPTHLSTVPFVWNYLGTERPMRFFGGIVGADNDEGFVTPRLSYGVLHAAPDVPDVIEIQSLDKPTDLDSHEFFAKIGPYRLKKVSHVTLYTGPKCARQRTDVRSFTDGNSFSVYVDFDYLCVGEMEDAKLLDRGRTLSIKLKGEETYRAYDLVERDWDDREDAHVIAFMDEKLGVSDSFERE